MTLLKGAAYFEMLLYAGLYSGVVVRTESLHEVTRPDFRRRMRCRKHAFPYFGGVPHPSPLPPFARRAPTPYPHGREEEEAEVEVEEHGEEVIAGEEGAAAAEDEMEEDDVDPSVFDRDSPYSPISQDDYFDAAAREALEVDAGFFDDLPELEPIERPRTFPVPLRAGKKHLQCWNLLTPLLFIDLYFFQIYFSVVQTVEASIVTPPPPPEDSVPESIFSDPLVGDPTETVQAATIPLDLSTRSPSSPTSAASSDCMSDDEGLIAAMNAIVDEPWSGDPVPDDTSAAPAATAGGGENGLKKEEYESEEEEEAEQESFATASMKGEPEEATE